MGHRRQIGSRSEDFQKSPHPKASVLIHTWLFNTWFLGRLKSLIFEVSAAPASPTTIPSSGGRSPPTFWNGFLGRRGRPNPKSQKSTISGRPKNHQKTLGVAWRGVASVYADRWRTWDLSGGRTFRRAELLQTALATLLHSTVGLEAAQ